MKTQVLEQLAAMDNEVAKLSDLMLKFIDKVDEKMYNFMGEKILAYRDWTQYLESDSRTVKVWFQPNHLHLEVRRPYDTTWTGMDNCTVFNVTHHLETDSVRVWTEVGKMKFFLEDLKYAKKIVKDALKKDNSKISEQIVKTMDKQLREDLYIRERQ